MKWFLKVVQEGETTEAVTGLMNCFFTTFTAICALWGEDAYIMGKNATQQRQPSALGNVLLINNCDIYEYVTLIT